MKRKQPSFSEEYHGYPTFSRLLEDAAKNKIIKLHKDSRSGTYVVDELLVHHGDRSSKRSQPRPSWPKLKASGCRISARISRDSTTLGPGRLKY